MSKGGCSGPPYVRMQAASCQWTESPWICCPFLFGDPGDGEAATRTGVNGQDLSQSSHDEAVEVFRTATEPIVVEVLRRVGKSSSGSGKSGKATSSSSVSSSSNASKTAAATASARPHSVGGLVESSSSSSLQQQVLSKSGTMVSIATQTEEEFYCVNRPPTPPPAGLYPMNISGLYQPSSRRPVAFSPSAEMGLTDIEMSHPFDLDDAFFDERQYEMVYEEVVLHRSSSDEKLGLTLCYGSLEDEVTDIFISEIDPCSVAGRDGRVREGDQILQVNGVDVHSRDQAISLFSSQDPDITLLVARPQLQMMDDGFLEEPSLVLEDLHMDLLEKHHHHNMTFMASMLARARVEEEGGGGATTDSGSAQRSSHDQHEHEKASGVGRHTDGSVRNEENCVEQDLLDGLPGGGTAGGGGSSRGLVDFSRGASGSPVHLYTNECLLTTPSSFSAEGDFSEHVYAIPHLDYCSKFRHMLEDRVGMGQGGQLLPVGGSSSSSPPSLTRMDSEDSLERELAQLNKEMEEIQVECQEIVESHLLKEQQQQQRRILVQQLPTYVHYDEPSPTSNGGGGGGAKSVDSLRSPRVVPRMGTRLDLIKHVQALEQFDLWSQQRRMALATAAAAAAASGEAHGTSLSSGTGTGSSRSEREKDLSATTTSAYNTGGESCRSTPLTLELNAASDGSEKGFKNSMLCLAPTTTTTTTTSSSSSAPPPPHSSSDTEKQTQTPSGKSRSSSSEESGGLRGGGSVAATENLRAAGLSGQAESLQDIYMRSADIMYTNRANLQHTIAVQQKLFQQQLEQQKRLRLAKTLPGGAPSLPHSCSTGLEEVKQGSASNTAPSDSGGGGGGQMEWVVKRRPDGTRYITRRPVRSKILKERAKKITEERSGMTTDDDAMSELKTGRYWSREERKRHLEKAKDYKRRKETILKQRMETLKEGEEKKEVNIVELSHRKMNKHKNKKVLDNFVTVQEITAHGSRIPDGKAHNPLLSVTTV